MSSLENLIKTFKQKNGGEITYSTKELIAALYVKIDKIDEKLNSHCKKITALETLTALLYALFVAILVKLFF